MVVSSSVVLFIFRVFFRIFIVISLDSLLLCWIGLELNTLAFLPLLLLHKSSLSSESSIKYFLIQTLASIIILLRGVIIKFSLFNLREALILGMLIKLGAAPFHNWVIRLVRVIDWGPLFIFLTFQKIIPLTILAKFEPNWLVWSRVIGSAFMGSWGGVAQTNIRKLIGFSSIINIGWLLARTIVSFKLVVLYFTVYCLTLVPLVYTLYQTSTSYFSQMSSTGMTLPQNILIWRSFFSLGGLPPFWGFSPKLLVLSFLGEGRSGYFLCAVLVFSRLWILFCYLRLIYNMLILAKTTVFLYKKTVVTFSSLALSQLILGLAFMHLF